MKIIAFDVFGTVFDMSSVPRSEIGSYVQHVKSEGEWMPLQLPPSWGEIIAHPDAREGIERLRQDFTVVTLSNGPLKLLSQISKRSGISWDAIIPIECVRAYKPNLSAYRLVMDLFDVEPSEVMMVTANPTFGDVEAANELGMVAQVIRQPDKPATIIELAETLQARSGVE